VESTLAYKRGNGRALRTVAVDAAAAENRTSACVRISGAPCADGAAGATCVACVADSSEGGATFERIGLGPVAESFPCLEVVSKITLPTDSAALTAARDTAPNTASSASKMTHTPTSNATVVYHDAATLASFSVGFPGASFLDDIASDDGTRCDSVDFASGIPPAPEKRMGAIGCATG
jgi:hypothetical protein